MCIETFKRAGFSIQFAFSGEAYQCFIIGGMKKLALVTAMIK